MKFKIVYADELYKVQKEMNALLIDIRTREEYDRSHWKGALSMPMDITDSYESELDASQSVIFYCTHGGSSMKLARYVRISKKVAEIWLKLFKKIEIYATILDNNVKYNYRKAVTQYMNRFELVVPCHFGLEAVVKREIYDLGYEITRVEDGRVSFEGDAEAICRANIFLRGAERVLLQVGRFKAATFDELFENVKALPWENYIPKDGRFWVKKASSIKSKLFSPSDIQSIVKKAMTGSRRTEHSIR